MVVAQLLTGVLVGFSFTDHIKPVVEKGVWLVFGSLSRRSLFSKRCFCYRNSRLGFQAPRGSLVVACGSEKEKPKGLCDLFTSLKFR